MMKAARMVAVVFCLFAVVLGVPGQARAQTTNKEKVAGKAMGAVEVTRADVRAGRQKIVSQHLSLSPSEAKNFWPVYRKYQEDVAKLNDPLVAMASNYARNYKTLTDKQASDMLDKYLLIKRKYRDTQKVYVNKFKKTIPNKKVLRFYQLEEEMDAIVNYDLAGSLPLAK
jgi:hypothetical protein